MAAAVTGTGTRGTGWLPLRVTLSLWLNPTPREGRLSWGKLRQWSIARAEWCVSVGMGCT